MGASSSSASHSDTITTNSDNRIAFGTAAGQIGLSGIDNSAVSITTNTSTTDFGAVSRAFDSIDASNALYGQGATALLASAERMFKASTEQGSTLAQKAIEQGSALAAQTQNAVAQAYSDAKTNSTGTIDNRTIIVLAVAGAAAVYAMSRKG